MKKPQFEVVKWSGEKVKFSFDRLRASLEKSGATKEITDDIVETISQELYQGISTKEIYNRAYKLLKKSKGHFASRYKLKRAIYEFGPTGFPFERFISKILKYSGYSTQVDKVIQGRCVSHEIDVIASKDHETIIVECKFHSQQGIYCNVKVPLYINSRYQDIKAHWDSNPKKSKELINAWVVTNTRFTKDALLFGHCCGLYLLSWDYPKNDGIKDWIDRLGLYPITVSTLLTNREKQFLLSKDVVLCRELADHEFYLDHLGVSEARKEKILNEVKSLCNVHNHKK